MHATLCIDGELSNPIEYNSGVKQGCKLAPTLFGMYAAVLLYLAFKDINPCYSIKFVTDTTATYLISSHQASKNHPAAAPEITS